MLTNLLGVIGAAIAFSARSVIDCAIFFWCAEVSGATLARLVPPFLLMAGTTVTAALLDGSSRYAILCLLLTASAIWSAMNIPDMLRPFLGKLSKFLPAAKF
jgi:hypothetical protein